MYLKLIALIIMNIDEGLKTTKTRSCQPIDLFIELKSYLLHFNKGRNYFHLVEATAV